MLMWSHMFKFREIHSMPEPLPGTYVRDREGWIVCVRRKERYYRGPPVEWQPTSVELLPKVLRLEALLLGIGL